MEILKILQIVTSIISGAIGIGTVLILIIKWLRNGNAKKVLNLFKNIPNLVKQAESLFGKGKGAEKFHWVMRELQFIAMKTHTRVNEKELEIQINDVVDTTNNVNVDKFPFSTDVKIADNKEVIVLAEPAQTLGAVPETIQVMGENKND